MDAPSVKNPGRFITLEGGEGAGKSTQIQVVKDFLLTRGNDVVVTREPGGTSEGQEIRNLLVSGDKDKWSPLSETLLILADRAAHLERVIRPALAEGKYVVCDRFFDSTRAYQGVAGGLGLDVIHNLQQPVLGTTLPDVTLLLDIDPEKGLRRAQERGGELRFESKTLAYHRTLRNAFLDFAAQEPDRIFVIDADRDVEVVSADILAVLDERLDV
ncbi:putative transcriptional regulator protein [Candidatus Micropelagos thuwalensis]|uniref:Thymidylate kinase n=1 Tax=Candidatus Micropelagius thuwalensis TaxID=1397666 RepID=U2XWX1_9PROT|nr:dTMP kinase [Candidatus Micropelagos thuwalensis]ERL47356.1 putative transcriptional regulator protein [Candidatus Micropelagos thuwalensis]